MQFILDGRLYDTASSVAVAISRGVVESGQWSALPAGAESMRYEEVLYRTKNGNFFVHEHSTVKFPRGKPVVEDVAKALAPQEAVRWVEQNGAMLLDSTGLPLPDEA